MRSVIIQIADLFECLLDSSQLGSALSTLLAQRSLCSTQLLLHALVLSQVHLTILLLQLLRPLLPLLRALCRLQFRDAPSAVSTQKSSSRTAFAQYQEDHESCLPL